MSHLFLAPHNDDETLFGAFTLLRHQPFVVVCLRSFRMTDPSYPGGVPIHYEQREQETGDAMDWLGCQWTQWEHSDAAPDWEKVLGDLEDLRDGRIDWEHVWAPADVQNGHPQHNVIANIASEVFGKKVPITYYLTYTAGGKDRYGREVEFEPEWVSLKHRALACYESQAAHPATRSHFLDDIREYVR